MATKRNKKTVTVTLSKTEVEALQEACGAARDVREKEYQKGLRALASAEDKLSDIDTYAMDDDDDDCDEDDDF